MLRYFAAGCTALMLGAGVVAAQDEPFGTQADADYAQQLWEAMKASNLAGENAIRTIPYEGTEPHGMLLETFFADAEIEGHIGALVIKRNYGPEGVTPEEVQADPDKHLAAVTIMYRREEGYDADNGNWFWVKYLPDGSLDKNPAGMQLAGRVAKGADAGCIACHAGAPGEDYLFTTD
ncbi:cytochrome P460 family protein [Sulfitobacter aestuarii]|uniref:Cytochrome P460 family protein n=1 Tax=Sulfitobacter aestuarii TaxID=2161676 RepID=A0ABW5TZF6_9RHOB